MIQAAALKNNYYLEHLLYALRISRQAIVYQPIANEWMGVSFENTSRSVDISASNCILLAFSDN